MSNLDAAPEELTCSTPENSGVRKLLPREVPLGGLRAMSVRRTLPQRDLSLIGAWCFVDHYGPNDVPAGGTGMRVDGHPHTGLQTVSWLFSGEVEHRDTAGTHAFVRPGELNLMTAGSGIAHSEYSTPDTTTMHGVQLWVALPEQDRFTTPGFDHYAPPRIERDGMRARIFLGSLLGQTSPVPTFSPLLGAELTLSAGSTVHLGVEPTFEHGILVDTGAVTIGGVAAQAGELVYHQPGAATLTLRSTVDTATRVLLLGGEPFGEQIVMWWNFIGRSHDEIVAFREKWQQQREHGQPNADGGFGVFPEQWAHTLSAPALPNARLTPRGNRSRPSS